MTKAEIPDRERDCDEWIYSPLLVKLMPVCTKMRLYKRKEAKTQVWSRKGAAGLNTKETWVRWEDFDQKLDTLSLAVACDMVGISDSLTAFQLSNLELAYSFFRLLSISILLWPVSANTSSLHCVCRLRSRKTRKMPSGYS